MDWMWDGTRRKISGDSKIFGVENSKDRVAICGEEDRVERSVEGGDLEGKSQNLILDMVSLKYLLDIQMKIPKSSLDIQIRRSREKRRPGVYI